MDTISSLLSCINHEYDCKWEYSLSSIHITSESIDAERISITKDIINLSSSSSIGKISYLQVPVTTANNNNSISNVLPLIVLQYDVQTILINPKNGKYICILRNMQYL